MNTEAIAKSLLDAGVEVNQEQLDNISDVMVEVASTAALVLEDLVEKVSKFFGGIHTLFDFNTVMYKAIYPRSWHLACYGTPLQRKKNLKRWRRFCESTANRNRRGR